MTEKPETKLPFTKNDLTAYLEAAGLAFVSMERKIKAYMDISDEEFIRLRKRLEEFLDTVAENARNVDDKKRKFRVIISRMEVVEKEFEVEVEEEKSGIVFTRASAHSVALEKAHNTEYPRAATAEYEIVLTEEITQ